ncbi:MAG: Ig-like domain-containing protein [Caldilineaceae bacterium]|nr:Ig-like domain-containing protein [Caldilineaceae bacterium]
MTVVQEGGPWYHADAAVTIVDSGGQPVNGATVNGTFSGDSSGAASGVTNANGLVTLSSARAKNGQSWTFCVDSVSRGSDVYDAGANGETCDSTGGSSPTATPQPTNTPTPGPTPTTGPGVVMHIGDLDGSAAPGSRNRWDATVLITVHDANESPVANATVDGSWSGGANGGGSCVTNGAGQCSVGKANLKGNTTDVTFTVNNVTLAGSSYNAGANHDPDGDSNGTSITVLQP